MGPIRAVGTYLKIEKIIISCPGLPDVLGTIYQHGGKYTKSPQNIPKDHKIFQIAVK
jgi:hypothetical protein